MGDLLWVIQSNLGNPGAEMPAEVVEFARETAAIWAPAPVFVLDVARSADQLYVVEANCFHSAGFYAAVSRYALTSASRS